MESWVPDACTLPTAEQPLRVAEFDGLFASSTRAVRRLDTRELRVSLSGEDDLADRVRELAARESACCSFFSFTVTVDGEGEVLLDVAVPDEYVHVLDALATRAAAQLGGST